MQRELATHDAHTVPEMGWSGKKNGELLQLMAGKGFEVLLTVDQNICRQQKLQTGGIAVIVLVAVSNRWSSLVSLMPSVLAVIGSIKPGLRTCRLEFSADARLAFVPAVVH